MKISKMKLKYSSLFFVPFVVMLGVFLSLGLTPFSQNSIHSGDFLSQYFPLYIGLHKLFWSGDLVVYFGPSRNHLEEPCQVSGALIV